MKRCGFLTLAAGAAFSTVAMGQDMVYVPQISAHHAVSPVGFPGHNTGYGQRDILPIYGTIWLLLMVFVIARISYATRMTNAGLIQIHPELEESAAVSGATTFTAFRRVSVPLMAATLLYAWLWIALLTFRELTLAVIMTTSGNVTFPVVVWTIWLGGGLAPASAVAVVMLLLMTPLIALYWMFARRQGILAT